MWTALCFACAMIGPQADARYDLAFVARFYHPERTRISHAYLYLADLSAKHRRRICRVGSMWVSPFWVGRNRVAWTQLDHGGVGIWVVDAPKWKPRRLLVVATDTGPADISEAADSQVPTIRIQIGGRDYLLTPKGVRVAGKPDTDLAPGFGSGTHRIGSAAVVHGRSGWSVEVRSRKTVHLFPIVNADTEYQITDHIEGKTRFSLAGNGRNVDIGGHFQTEDPARTWMVARIGIGLGELALLFTIDWKRNEARSWLLDVADLSLRPRRGLFAGRSESHVRPGGGANVWVDSAVVGDLETGKVKTVLSGDVFVGGISLRP